METECNQQRGTKLVNADSLHPKLPKCEHWIMISILEVNCRYLGMENLTLPWYTGCVFGWRYLNIQSICSKLAYILHCYSQLKPIYYGMDMWSLNEQFHFLPILLTVKKSSLELTMTRFKPGSFGSRSNLQKPLTAPSDWKYVKVAPSQ